MKSGLEILEQGSIRIPEEAAVVGSVRCGIVLARKQVQDMSKRQTLAPSASQGSVPNRKTGGYLQDLPTIITIGRFGKWALGMLRKTFFGIGGIALLVVLGFFVASALVDGPLRWYLIGVACALLLLCSAVLALSYVRIVLNRLMNDPGRTLEATRGDIPRDAPIITDTQLRELEKRVYWRTLKNRYRGQRAFLIGNGPSLNRTPLHLLKNEHTMCFNRFDLMFERLGWRPTMYMCVDHRVATDMADRINEIVPKVGYAFVPDIHPRGLDFRNFIEEYHNVFWLSLEDVRTGCFRDDLPTCMKGGTVAFSALQVLAFMGFSPIYLVGVDMDYEDHATALKHNRVDWTATRDDDPNHFDPRYFGAGARYHRPHLDSMLPFLQRAKEHLDGKGVEVLNAGIGGSLEIFPRVDFRSLFDADGETELDLLLSAIPSGLQGEAGAILQGSIVVEAVDGWDGGNPLQVTTLHLAVQLIPKVIFTHIPYGPFGNRYLFIRRDSIAAAAAGAAPAQVDSRNDG